MQPKHRLLGVHTTLNESLYYFIFMRSVTETPYKLFSTYSETIPKVASITGFKTCVIEQRNHYEVRNHNEDRIFFYQWRAKSLSSLSSTHLMCESVECPQKWRNITAFSSTEYPCHSLHSSTPIKVWKCITFKQRKDLRYELFTGA